MFYRKIINELNQWAEEKDRKPLILRGARQVGKTTAIDIFSKAFDRYIYLNLEKKEDAEIFNNDLPLKDLIQAIYLSKNIPPSGGRTLLFIDEIQNSPHAVNMMRYFYESAGDIHVTAAGSLLETIIGKDQISFPVGRVQYKFMYPLTFEEFLSAIEAGQALDLYHTIPCPEFAFTQILRHFHTYCLIGGMPEIIKNYREKEDVPSLTPIYQGLLTSYLDDVSKYARNATMIQVIRHAIESVPFEAGKRIKFQGFGRSNYRSREMGEALRTLQRAMLIYLLYPSTSTEPPIIPDLRKSPRLQFLDTGLINYFVNLQSYFYKAGDLHSFYQGLLAEHIVGQELLAIDMNKPGNTSFWIREKKQSNAEVDFIIPYKEYIIPVEVKSGKTGALRSLHQFIDRSNHPYAIRLYAGPLEKIQTKTPAGKPYTLLNLPYFLAGKIYEYIEWLIPPGT
ncbi:MAG: ATP-binding protein [Syntrophobacterales bacterium]|nr:ATP-binding protein [Syntrophobacterales bacterium]